MSRYLCIHIPFFLIQMVLCYRYSLWLCFSQYFLEIISYQFIESFLILFFTAAWPLIVHTCHGFNLCPMYGHLGCSQYFAITNMLQGVTLCLYIFVLVLIYLQGTSLEKGLLGRKVSACLVLSDIAMFRSRRVTPICIPNSSL